MSSSVLFSFRILFCFFLLFLHIIFCPSYWKYTEAVPCLHVGATQLCTPGKKHHQAEMFHKGPSMNKSPQWAGIFRWIWDLACMLQIYKVSRASSGGRRLRLDPPEGISLWRQNNSFSPLPQSLPLTTCQNSKFQRAAAKLLFLGSNFHGGCGTSSPPSQVPASPAAWREQSM